MSEFETNEEVAADALLDGDYETDAPTDTEDDESRNVEPTDRGDLHEAVREDASGRREMLKGATHEHNAHLLFDGQDDGFAPFFALVSEFEPAQRDDDGTLRLPALAGVEDFDAAGSTWSIDRRSDHEDPDEYEKGTVRYWEGGIATRPEDAGETYYEYQIPVYDTDDEKRNRRVTFQFRPSLPDAETTDGNRIGSMPADLPLGIRVEVNSSNVDTDEVLPILRGLADALGLKREYFARERIHEWSNVYGLALYVRVLRDLADDLLVGPEGIISKMAKFASARHGRGEWKWNNQEVFGQRSAVAMNPTGLEKLYTGHTVGKLVKSYLMKFASRRAAPPEVEPTDHPKLEVQWNREHTPGDLTVRWLPEHADEDELDRHDLETELRTLLLNVLQWAGLPTTPKGSHDGDDRTPIFVEDDHFHLETLDDEERERISLLPSPLDDAVEHERSLVTRELIENPPTDAEEDVLRSATDGGHFDGVAELAEQSDRSTSTVSRTVKKFERLFERAEGITVADSVVRDRLSELFATLDSAIDRVERGLGHLGSGDTPVDEDSAFGRWADRYGASMVRDRGSLRVRIAAGNFDLYELRTLLRSGYVAARDTLGIEETEFLDAGVEFYDEEGDRETFEKVAVWHGNGLKILGGEDVFALG